MPIPILLISCGILLISCGPSVLALVRALYFISPGWALFLVGGVVLFVAVGFVLPIRICGVPVSRVPLVTALVFAVFGPVD